MSRWQDRWEAQQRAIRDAIPQGGLIEPVLGEIVNFRMTEPLRCEDREFCEESLDATCNSGPLFRRVRGEDKAIAEAIAIIQKKSDHVQRLTLEDRDGNPISPTCAYCGRAVQFCTGSVE